MAIAERYRCLLLALLVIAGVWLQGAEAQTLPSQQSSSGSSTSSNRSNTPNIYAGSGLGTGIGFPSYDPNLSHRQQVARREELHRKMLENATRLLSLTRELQDDLHQHEANDADAKRLDDIGRLARMVRDQMRQ